MKEELNNLLHEYMARLRDFSNQSADFLSDQMYTKMQGVFIREFDNELKLLKKKNDFVAKTSSRIQKLVFKALKRDCKTESKDIASLDFLDVISEYLPIVSSLQQGDVNSLQKFQLDSGFIDAFQEFYSHWKSNRSNSDEQVEDLIEDETSESQDDENVDGSSDVVSESSDTEIDSDVVSD